MEGTPIIDGALERVLQAIDRFGKLRLATKAEISESSIRNAGRDGWNPTSDLLRKLEIAAIALEAEHGPADAAAHRESDAANPAEAAR